MHKTFCTASEPDSNNRTQTSQKQKSNDEKRGKMTDKNFVLIEGRLGSDPEIRTTSNGTQVTTISVATRRSWKQKDALEWTEETTWHRVVCWGSKARALEAIGRKGKTVIVTGRIQTRKFEKEGEVREIREVVADSLSILNSIKRETLPDDETLNSQPIEDEIPF